jgi:hypothetical protein
MQRHLIATLNTLENIDAMNSIAGVELVKTDSDFAIWYCVGLSRQDLEAIRSTGTIMLNKPPEDEAL